MDFNDQRFGKKDAYNGDLMEALQEIHPFPIPEDALLLGQVTRVVGRKNIEASIELLKGINEKRGDKKTFLVITGEESIGDKRPYKKELSELAKRLGVSEQVVWAADIVKPTRRSRDEGNKKVYSLSDFYAHLAERGMMTYPSTYEGFGNAFVEAVLAKVPIIANNYEPIFWEELGQYGFDVVQMWAGKASPSVIEETHLYLKTIEEKDSGVKEMVERNFQIGKKHFSYERAGEIIRGAISEAVEMANTQKSANLSLPCHSSYTQLQTD